MFGPRKFCSSVGRFFTEQVDKSKSMKRPATALEKAPAASSQRKISNPFKYVSLNTWAIKVDGKQWVSVPCQFFCAI